jgi:hypothetical protein
MPNANTPVAWALSASANAVGTQVLEPDIHAITVVNRPTGTSEVFITLDGSTPTVGGNNQWYVPPGGIVTIPVATAPQAELASQTPVTLQAISATALSIWIEVDQ